MSCRSRGRGVGVGVGVSGSGCRVGVPDPPVDQTDPLTRSVPNPQLDQTELLPLSVLEQLPVLDLCETAVIVSGLL